MKSKNAQVLLARHPQGRVRESDFSMVESAMPDIADGQVLVRNHFVSLDPYMRWCMNAPGPFAPRVAVGDVMIGETVGEVVESRYPGLEKGDRVAGYLGWQTYGVEKGDALKKLNTRIVSLQAYLGILGKPGVAAWVGMNDLGRPRRGETVVVADAAGAVGSVAVQLAKNKGCFTLGIADGPSRCWVLGRSLGLDACLDRGGRRFYHDFKAATPNGVDVFCEAGGADVRELVFERLNARARVAMCGSAAGDGCDGVPVEDDAFFPGSGVQVGWLSADTMEARAEVAALDLGRRLGERRLRFVGAVENDLSKAPTAFVRMLDRGGVGRQLVRV